MENKQIRLAGIIEESLVNGEGLRRVIFSQGCKHNCKGCHNPYNLPMDGGVLVDMDEILADIEKTSFLGGVTFSGGDPFEQADKFAYMAKEIKKMGLNIWCYTGYTYEYIIENKDTKLGWNDLMHNIDVLVDGKFEEDKKDKSLKFKGSSNQRIINVKESLSSGNIILHK